MIIKHSQGHIDSIYIDEEWKIHKDDPDAEKVEAPKKKVEEKVEEKV